MNNAQVYQFPHRDKSWTAINQQIPSSYEFLPNFPGTLSLSLFPCCIQQQQQQQQLGKMLKCRSSLRVKCTTYAIDTCVQQNSLTLESFMGPRAGRKILGSLHFPHAHTHTHPNWRDVSHRYIRLCVCVRVSECEQSNAAEKTLKQNVVYIL